MPTWPAEKQLSGLKWEQEGHSWFFGWKSFFAEIAHTPDHKYVYRITNGKTDYYTSTSIHTLGGAKTAAKYHWLRIIKPPKKTAAPPPSCPRYEVTFPDGIKMTTLAETENEAVGHTLYRRRGNFQHDGHTLEADGTKFGLIYTLIRDTVRVRRL